MRVNAGHLCEVDVRVFGADVCRNGSKSSKGCWRKRGNQKVKEFRDAAPTNGVGECAREVEERGLKKTVKKAGGGKKAQERVFFCPPKICPRGFFYCGQQQTAHLFS